VGPVFRVVPGHTRGVAARTVTVTVIPTIIIMMMTVMTVIIIIMHDCELPLLNSRPRCQEAASQQAADGRRALLPVGPFSPCSGGRSEIAPNLERPARRRAEEEEQEGRSPPSPSPDEEEEEEEKGPELSLPLAPLNIAIAARRRPPLPVASACPGGPIGPRKRRRENEGAGLENSTRDKARGTRRRHGGRRGGSPRRRRW
jgi:hypothetical protein